MPNPKKIDCDSLKKELHNMCVETKNNCTKIENDAQRNRCMDLLAETIPQVSENPGSCYVRIQNGLKMPYMGSDAATQCFNSCVKFAKDFKTRTNNVTRQKEPPRPDDMQKKFPARHGRPPSPYKNRQNSEMNKISEKGAEAADQGGRFVPDGKTKFLATFNEASLKLDFSRPTGTAKHVAEVTIPISNSEGELYYIRLNLAYAIFRTGDENCKMDYSVMRADRAEYISGLQTLETFWCSGDNDFNDNSLQFAIELRGPYQFRNIKSVKIINM